jgi:hypothetical protein
MAAVLPTNYVELVGMLNAIPEFHSPPAGPLALAAGAVTPYDSLGQGTRLLISLADSMHDLKKVKTIPGVVRPSGPGQATLKAWGRNLILRLAAWTAAVQAAQPAGFVDRMLDIIYTAPENFVHYYLYYYDMFYYTNYQYISEPSPLTVPGVAVQVQNRNGQNVIPYHFLLLNYPPHGNSGKATSLQSVTAGANYSKLSASILYKIYEKLFEESNWDMTSGIPPDTEGTQYSPYIRGTDGKWYTSIWYSCDQGAPNKIFHQYDCQKNVPAPHFDGLTNWYMWIGYAAQYDRTDLISASEAAKLYCNSAAHCIFTQNPGLPDNLRVTLSANESMLGINQIVLNENNFIWQGRDGLNHPISYDLPMRANMKTYLQNALGYVDDQGQQNAPNLWAQIFACKQGFAAMIDELCPGFCIKTGGGLILGLNFAQNSTLSDSFPSATDPNSGITYHQASRRYDALSLFTDFKRIGDYLQAKEIYGLNFLRESPMPLLTHDGILAAISHKIFNNHTVWSKPAKIDRSATYIVMLPDDVTLRINKTANANSKLPNAAGVNAAHLDQLRPMANAIMIEFFINNIMNAYPGDYTQRMWGGRGRREGGMGRGTGKGKGRGSFAVPRHHPFGTTLNPKEKEKHEVHLAEQKEIKDIEHMRTHTGESVARSVARSEVSVPQACLWWMRSETDKIKEYYSDGNWEQSLRELWVKPIFWAKVQTFLPKVFKNETIRFEGMKDDEKQQLLEFFIAYIKILLWETDDAYAEEDIMEHAHSASAAIVHMHYLYTLMDEDVDDEEMGYVYNDIYNYADGNNEMEREGVKKKSGKKKKPRGQLDDAANGEQAAVDETKKRDKQEYERIREQRNKEEMEIENQVALGRSSADSEEVLEQVRNYLRVQANQAQVAAEEKNRKGEHVDVGEMRIYSIKNAQLKNAQLGGKGCYLVGKYNVTESKKTKIYLDNITKLKETNNVLKKNKIKNKNKIEKNNKQINELKEKIKKEKLKEKEKVKKEKLKEKLKKAKLKEKEKEKLKKKKKRLKNKN